MPETTYGGLNAPIVGTVSLAIKPAVSRCAVCGDVADGYDAELERAVCRRCAELREGSV
ncbi:hypothetical protein [Halarchaeum grantii]|uniref:hypothetical protein n=1 Tax=Halarchaeum grantii TaxID=1193105 RepID=UPI00166C48D5|nr:hypothetical protein [Halarchaeum grantii]